MLSIHNVFTPAAGVQSHHTYVLSTASYGCRAEAHQDKSWETDIPADLSTPALVTRPAWALNLRALGGVFLVRCKHQSIVPVSI